MTIAMCDSFQDYSRVQDFEADILKKVEGLRRNISVKFKIWASGSGDVVKKDFSFFFSSAGHLVQWSRTVSTILLEGLRGKICVKVL